MCLLVLPCALGDVVCAKRSAQCLLNTGCITFHSLQAQHSCKRWVLYLLLLKAPFLRENTRLCWPRLLQGSVKRPLCVSFKAGLCFVSLALCKGTEQQLLAPGQAGPRELRGQASVSRLSGQPSCHCVRPGGFSWPAPTRAAGLPGLPCPHRAPSQRHSALHTQLPIQRGFSEKKKEAKWVHESVSGGFGLGGIVEGNTPYKHSF